MFVDFLPDYLLKQRRVVIAHGVQGRQDAVFQAYKEQFDTLSEADFIIGASTLYRLLMSSSFARTNMTSF